MKNIEKYKNELEKVLVQELAVSKSGDICRCEDMGTCGRCIFYGDTSCVDLASDWLNS